MRIILIDGMQLAYRAQFSSGRLATESGKPTGVIYSFIKLLNSIRIKFGNQPVLVFWEGGYLEFILEGKEYKVSNVDRIPLWRKTLVPSQGYKSNRKITPDVIAIHKQIPEVHRVLSYLKYPQYSVPGTEGDDLIGIVACQLSIMAGVEEVCIISTDKDFYQCINTVVNVYRPGKGTFDKYDMRRVLKEFNVPVHYFAHYKAFLGEGGDHYSGLKGVGPAAAVKLYGLGAKADRSWNHQPSEVLVEFPKLKDIWNKAKESYMMAKIPTTWDHRYWDDALKSRTKEALKDIEKNLYRKFTRSELEASLQLFVKFCSKYELMSLVADKRKYFEGVMIVGDSK